jgi:hypothetical protein
VIYFLFNEHVLMNIPIVIANRMRQPLIVPGILVPRYNNTNNDTYCGTHYTCS